jgi:endonuclease III
LKLPRVSAPANASATTRDANFNRIASVVADDVRFDYEVVPTADHDEMFDMVAANDNKLAALIEREGLHNAKAPRIAGSLY